MCTEITSKHSSVSCCENVPFSDASIYSSPNWNVESSANHANLQPSYFVNLSPPPEYPGSKPHELRRSYETVERTDMTTCRYQPDLSRYMEAHNKPAYKGSGHLTVEPDQNQRYICTCACAV